MRYMVVDDEVYCGLFSNQAIPVLFLIWSY
jgi:hypothetical protein